MTALNQCHVSFEDKDGDQRNKEVLLATTKKLKCYTNFEANHFLYVIHPVSISFYSVKYTCINVQYGYLKFMSWLLRIYTHKT